LPDTSALALEVKLKSAEKVDLSYLPREKRLGVINDLLNHLKLKSLDGLGDAEQGQMEFIGINGLSLDPFQPGKFITRLDFETLVKAGDKEIKFNHLCLVNANTAELSGVIIVPLIRVAGEEVPYVALVRQFRPALGRTTVEVTRGFPDPADLLNTKQFSGALRELNEETGLLNNRERIEVKEISLSDENSGTSNITNTITKVEFSMTKEEFNAAQGRIVTDIDSLQSIGTIIVPLNKAIRFVRDLHSQAAIGLVLADEYEKIVAQH
jgi:hypothetical protein